MILNPRRFRMMMASAGVCGFVAVACSSGQDRPGWVLNWQDEFAGTAVNTARWEVLSRRDSYNNEKQYYLPQQVSVAGGQLRITATNQPISGKPYRSGLIRTWEEQTYGRWEVRGSLPTGQGMWPAIWLLPRTVNWPSGGEIDIMENRGSQPTIVGSAYHFGADFNSHQYVGSSFSYAINHQPVSFHGSMHTYAVEWDADRLQYFVDDVPFYTLYRDDVPISSTPMSLIINLAVGGDYGGDPDPSTQFPQHFDIDYVRVYRRDTQNPNLANGSFETRAGELIGSWREYGNGFNVGIDENAGNARSGNAAAKLFGRFDGSTFNNSGLFQEIAATPGQTVQLNAFARNRPGDALLGLNTAQIKIEFIDGDGDVIDAAQMPVVDATTSTHYQEFVLRRTAPAGTKFARAVIEMIQRNNAGGAVNFDDVSLRLVGTAAAFDVNLDGSIDSRDVDALIDSLNPLNTHLDFDRNTAVNDADIDAFLLDAFSTRRGDAGLNGTVDFNDLLAVARNYGRSDAHWADGDFTGEGAVNFDDLLQLARFFSSNNVAIASGDAFASDWIAARAVVPEPAAAACLSLVATAALTRLRRRI